MNQVKTDPKDSPLAYIVGVLQLLATLVALAGLYFLWQQVRTATTELESNRKDAQNERAAAMQERYTAREFRGLASKALAFLDAADAADCVQKLRAVLEAPWAGEECLPRTPRMPLARPSIHDVQQVMGFFEELGVMFNREIVTPDVILNSFATPPVQMFNVGWWYLCWSRDGEVLGETDLFDQWDLMQRAIRRARPRLSAEWKPTPSIGMLCLPAAKAPRTVDWERCERLSKALSARVVAAEGVDCKVFGTVVAEIARAVDKVHTRYPAPGRPFAVRLLGIPRNIQVSATDWRRVRKGIDEAAAQVSTIGDERFGAFLTALGAEGAV